MKTSPSIFNDVIGPVMRGPSSSHTAASHRIGSMIRQFCQIKGSQILVEFDQNGSLATTYEGQGSAMGLISGLAGISILDPVIINYKSIPQLYGFNIEFRVTNYQALHPNTYKICVETSDSQKYEFTAVSTGGGMFELEKFNGFQVSIKGDCFETLVFYGDKSPASIEEIQQNLRLKYNAITEYIFSTAKQNLLRIKIRKALKDHTIELLQNTGTIWIKHIDPILPIMPDVGTPLPFHSVDEMIKLSLIENLSLAELATRYESIYAGIGISDVLTRMKEIVDHVNEAITKGLEGNDYEDRILGHQSHLTIHAERSGKIIASPHNKIIAYVTAIMESKSSMEVIVAAPTAGSCGALGGALFAAAEYLNAKIDDIVKAYLAAGIIGVFIADEYTFAAEEGGCQVECGAASAMTAAGLVQLMGGNAVQAVNAASMALQNCLGLICDPVADRVEVPCLGKNILAATNALNSANMSIAGYNPVIPLDEVISALKSVGAELPRTLCCTGLGGLSQTPTSKRIFDHLANKTSGKNYHENN